MFLFNENYKWHEVKITDYDPNKLFFENTVGKAIKKVCHIKTKGVPHLIVEPPKLKTK